MWVWLWVNTEKKRERETCSIYLLACNIPPVSAQKPIFLSSRLALDSAVLVSPVRVWLLYMPACLISVSNLAAGNGAFEQYANIFQRFVARLVLGFLQLLLNTRYDLALLRLLAACETPVFVGAFGRPQGDPLLSLFQQAISFVRRRQLNCKGHASPLEPYGPLLAKVLATFDKLQVCLQEQLPTIPVSALGFQRLLKIISTTLLSRDFGRVDSPSMAAVSAAMTEHFQRLLSVLPTHPSNTWRQTLQYFVDFESKL